MSAPSDDTEGGLPQPPETCPPGGHSWPGPATSEPRPCLCGEKTMSVEYVASLSDDDTEGGGT